MRSFICAAVLSAALLPAQTAEKRTHQWWNDRPVGGRPYTANAKKMPPISVMGY